MSFTENERHVNDHRKNKTITQNPTPPHRTQIGFSLVQLYLDDNMVAGSDGGGGGCGGSSDGGGGAVAAVMVLVVAAA